MSGTSIRMPIGIVVERRTIEHRWAQERWSAVAAIPGAPEPAVWRELDRGAGWTRFHAATLPLELHRNETDAYRYNLSSERPQLFVVMRPTLDVNGLPLVPFQVTASPYEGLAYTEFGDDRVDPVPMPLSLVAWVQDFIDCYHVDQPFYKRRRGGHDQAAGETSEFVPVGEGALSDE